MNGKNTRREFFAWSGALSAALASQAIAQQTSPNGLPTRRLGRTNEQVSILCLGGAHVGRAAEPVRLMHAAIDQGMTFFDNCWDYNEGYSEEVMGQALEGGKRKQVFLMTKNCGRDYEMSRRCLEDSLRRMKTDYLDLWQFHELVYDNDPDWIFEKGAMKYALEAQKAGKVRYIGFTGHKDPRIHLKMLDKGYDWASSQMPINVMDAFYRSFQKTVVPVCLHKDVGVIGMKGLGGGRADARIPTETPISAEECLRFALSLPIASLCVGMLTMEQLEHHLRVARNFQPMTEQERDELLKKAAPYGGDGRHELFKSTQSFDSGTHRRQHGFEA